MIDLPSGEDSLWIGVILALIGLVALLVGLGVSEFTLRWKSRMLLAYLVVVAVVILASR